MQLQWVLQTRVISLDNLEAEVYRICRRIAALPTKAIGLMKRSFKAAAELSFEDYLEYEAQGQRIAGLTADHREGVKAFMEKRKPVFIRTIRRRNT